LLFVFEKKKMFVLNSTALVLECILKGG